MGLVLDRERFWSVERRAGQKNRLNCLAFANIDTREIKLAKGSGAMVDGMESVDVRKLVYGRGDNDRLNRNGVRNVITMQGVGVHLTMENGLFRFTDLRAHALRIQCSKTVACARSSMFQHRCHIAIRAPTYEAPL